MKINNARFVKSLTRLYDRPAAIFPEIAVVGRSNVGKSSLINSLLNRRNLAKTSSTPGKTRLINYFCINENFYLVDLPGYGYRKVGARESEKWEMMMTDFFSQNKLLRLVLLLIDSRRGIGELDEMMIKMIDHYKIPYSIILTKRDKLSKNQYNILIKNTSQMLSSIPVTAYSTKSRIGREELLKQLDPIVNIAET